MTDQAPARERRPSAKGSTRYWGEHTVPESKAAFFNAVTTPAPSGDGSVATIRIYGPIDSWGGWWGISAKDVSAVLDALPDTVEQIVLRVNSPGGEVFEAISIVNLLRAHKASVTAVVDGLAASAASIVTVGCDEAVMSPGTQMMIHSPLVFTYGNAAKLRKTSDVLDKVEASMIELYAAKGGDADWPALLAEETWMTAAETVELGLADRVAVIPDAGETSTAGEDDDEVVVLIPADPDDDAVEDAAPIIRIAARASDSRTMLPVSSEPGDPNPKEALTMSDTIKAGLRERLGVTDASASDQTLLAALDEALAERTEPTTSALPEGVVTIEASQLEQMRADAAAGREAREAQIAAEREALVTAAVEDGRIAPARREHWVTALTADPGAAETLAGLQAGLIPVEAKGHTGGIDQASDEDVAYSKVFPTETTKEA